LACERITPSNRRNLIIEFHRQERKEEVFKPGRGARYVQSKEEKEVLEKKMNVRSD
jgi:hypothetical protein